MGPTLSAMLRYGLPLSGSIALFQIAASIDRFMLLRFGDAAAVGGYAAGFDVVHFVIGAIASTVSLVFYPRILAALKTDDPDVAGAKLRDHLSVLIGVLTPAAVGMAFVSPALAQLIIGSDLRGEAARIMPVICLVSYLAMLKAYFADFSFQLGRWTIGGVLTALLAVSVSIVSNLYMIPRYGAIGAAWAGALAFATSLAAALFLGRLYGYSLPGLDKVCLRSLLASGVMAAALWSQSSASADIASLVSSVGIGLTSYAGTHLMLFALGLRSAGCARPGDRHLARLMGMR
jgi:O-antigen/teichoic acid export membrane protein